MGVCEMSGKGMKIALSPVDTIINLFIIHLMHRLIHMLGGEQDSILVELTLENGLLHPK